MLGIQKKLSGLEIRHLKGLVKGDSQLSASKIATNLNARLPKPAPTMIMRRYMKDLALEYAVRIKN